MYKIEEMIKDEFLSYNNKKVKDETITEYLSSLKNSELTRFAITQVFVDEDYGNLFEVRNLNNRPKKYIINYIMNNLNKIIESYIKIINPSELKQLESVIKNNNKKIIFGEVKISLHFINILKSFSLAKVEYTKKENSLKFFMPKEFIEIFTKALKNKKILEENNYNYKVFEYASNVINAYGIITLDKLHELFCKQMFEIDINEFHHIISSIAIYEEIYLYEYDGKLLLCGIEFVNEDDACLFYSQQKMDYKIYNKDDYKKISDGTYVKELKSYKKFIDYLCKEYDIPHEDLEYINDFIVCDYISFAQISIENANNAFRRNIVQIFEIDEKEVEELLILMNNIYKEYPKWSKRGNV